MQCSTRDKLYTCQLNQGAPSFCQLKDILLLNAGVVDMTEATLTHMHTHQKTHMLGNKILLSKELLRSFVSHFNLHCKYGVACS